MQHAAGLKMPDGIFRPPWHFDQLATGLKMLPSSENANTKFKNST